MQRELGRLTGMHPPPTHTHQRTLRFNGGTRRPGTGQYLAILDPLPVCLSAGVTASHPTASNKAVPLAHPGCQGFFGPQGGGSIIFQKRRGEGFLSPKKNRFKGFFLVEKWVEKKTVFFLGRNLVGRGRPHYHVQLGPLPIES